MMLKPIESLGYSVYFNEQGADFLHQLLAEKNYSKLFLLEDSHTAEVCAPIFLQLLETNIPIEIIEIEAGEEHKNLDTCTQVWYALSELGADRHSVLINLGGGVVTDLGGFVASTFMRGIDFVNIPTSLLAMVDASVGGKTGVDLGSLKNQVGVINSPKGVIIDTQYLATLSREEFRSGLAEMFKHGLIASQAYWQQMCSLKDLDITDLDRLIYESVVIKNQIVMQDPREGGLRKTLNFGHTLGHAIESYCLQSSHRRRLLHGEAVAIGMQLACELSVALTGFPRKDCDSVNTTLRFYFPQEKFTSEEVGEIIQLLRFDKKNSHGEVRFVLLEGIGRSKTDCIVPEALIYQVFQTL